MFMASAFQTYAYEVAALSTTAAALAPGTAVTTVGLKIPTGIFGGALFPQVAAAGPKDPILGVVSAREGKPITNTIPPNSRFVTRSATFVALLVSAAVKQGDLVKVQTADGKFAQIAAGETPFAEMVEDAPAGSLAWAVILHGL
jgi:hypothetical protein